MQPRVPFLCFAALNLCAVAALAAPQVRELPLIKPERGVIHRWVALPAVLVPNRQVQLTARISGYVKEVKVDRGDLVKAGQLLAVIEVPELEVDLIKMQAELGAAEVELKRLRDARAKSPDLVLAQSVDNAEARFKAAQSSVNHSKTLLEFAQIKAPFDGKIASRSVDEGAFVSPGTGGFLRIVETQILRCQIPVTEMETPLLAVGQPVRISPDALPGKAFECKVSRLSGVLDQSSRTMIAEADLQTAGTNLIPGMSTTARIGVETHQDALRVPTGAVLIEKAGASVFRFVDGKAVTTNVKIGFNDGAFIELSEWKSDESVLVFGTTAIADGQTVSPKSTAVSK